MDVNSRIIRGSSNAPENSPARFESAALEPVGRTWPDSVQNKMAARISFLLRSEILSDVTFLVGTPGSETRYPAHRLLLSIRSPVFEAMFNESWGSEKKIAIADIDPAVFALFLRYLYTDQTEITPDTVMELIYAAKKYEIGILRDECITWIKSQFRTECLDAAFRFLGQTDRVDEPDLADLCMEYVVKHMEKVLENKEFLGLPQHLLNALLDRDDLEVLNETVLFKMANEWAEAECQRQNKPMNSESKRQVLGATVTKIRFPTMTLEEFAEGPAQSGMLTMEEINRLFFQFALRESVDLPYSLKPRLGPHYEVQRFECSSRIGPWQSGLRNHRVTFVVDRPVLLLGAGLHPVELDTAARPSQQNIVITVFSEPPSSEIHLVFDGIPAPPTHQGKIARAIFSTPVKLIPSIRYTINVKFPAKTRHNCYGRNYSGHILPCALPDGSFVNFSFAYSVWVDREESSESWVYLDHVTDKMLCSCSNVVPSFLVENYDADQDDEGRPPCWTHYTIQYWGQIPSLFFRLLPS